MALTIYPTTSYDSFCSLDDSNTIIAGYIPDTAQWDALTDAQKEVYLRQSSLIIEEKVSQLPTTLEENLKKATAILANHSIGLNMVDDSDSNKIKKKKVKDIEVEYFSAPDAKNEIPDLVISLLSVYNVQSSSTFSFSRG